MSFQVSHSFDPAFNLLLDKLAKKYGEEMFELEGIARKNLDIAGFTNKFLETKTTSDISIDANANVDDTSILSWNYEFPKPLAKLNAIYHLWSDAVQTHGIKRANKMVEAEIAGAIRIHDLHGWLMPYSYYRETPITIRINKGQPKIVTLKQLFDIYEENKVVLSDREYIDLTNVGKNIGYNNIPLKHKSISRNYYDNKNTSNVNIFEKHNIEVLDGDGKWTQLHQVLRHKRDVNMVAYQLNSGEYSIVTENHPVILEDGTEIDAGKLEIGMKVKLGNKSVFSDLADEYIDVPEEFAYFIGFILGDGNVGRHKFNSKNYNLLDSDLCINVTEYEGSITIYQKDIENTKIYNCVTKILNREDDLIRKSVKRDGNRISFNNRTIRTLMSKYFGLDYANSSRTKNLPINILSWTKASKLAFLAGLIDAEGSVQQNGKVEIRMSAMAVMAGLNEILISCGILSGITRFTGKAFENFYGISFDGNKELQKYSEKLAKVEITEIEHNHDTWNRDNTIKKIDIFNPETDIKLAYNLNEDDSEFYYVYDITTASHTFYSNGMTQHNCWAASLAPIVNEGMPWIKNIRVKPVKHFLTLISNSVKYIYNLSTQCVGAIAVPDFLAYAEYFIRKDYGEEWYNNEAHVETVRQLFQNWIYSVNDKARGNQSLTYDEKIIVDGKAIAIGEFVESILPKTEDSAPVLDTKYTFTLNRETGRLEANRIKGVIRHKTANKIVKYVLANGATIKATDNHSFFTRNGLKIEEIQRNSNPTNLLIPFNFAQEELEESELSVIQTVGKKSCNNIKLTEDWMYFLGQYLGDGCWDGSSIHIATCNDISNSILIDAMSEFTYSIKSDHSIRFNVGRNISDAIKAEFNTGSHNKVLSRNWVNKKHILHLIGGYIDSDGFAPTDGYKGFVLISVNKELIESIQFILSGYGIISSISEKEHIGFNNKLFTTYRLTISASGSRILNNYTRLKKVLVPEIASNIDSSKFYVDFKGLLTELNIDKSLIKNILKDRSIENDNCGYEDIKLLINILKKNNRESDAIELEKFLYALPVKIIDIQECDQDEYVYDISVENNENFLTASNIYAHNSPFVNVSVFDKYWRKAMFEKHTNPDFSTCNLDNLKRVQRLFVDVLIEEQQDNPFTFPVMTACQLKDAETGEILDKDWLEWVSRITVKNKLMNFYTSDTCDSLSSCCLSGEEIIHVINNETNSCEALTIKQFVNKFTKNEDEIIDKEFDTKYSIVTYNYKTDKWETEKIIGVLKKIADKMQLVELTVDGKVIKVTHDHKFMVHRLDNDTICEVTAKDIYDNPANYEVAIEE